jgi:HK97 family phage prohead protease
MTKKFIEGVCIMEKQGDDIVFVATDETFDRHGESIPMDSWDLSAYEAAPRLLVDHDHRVEKIVGIADKIKVNSKRITFTPKFHGLTQLSREVEAMVREGFLNTVSVGFIPHQAEKGEEYGRNELVEISLVTVPANPNAQRVKSLLDEAEQDEQKNLVQKFFQEGMKEMEGTLRFKSTEVQTLIFSKEKFGENEATKWATDHNFVVEKLDETDSSYRVRQFDPEKCAEGSERTIQLEEGVKAVVCRNDDQKCVDVVVDKDSTVVEENGKKQPEALSEALSVEEGMKGLSKEERAHRIMHGALKQTARIMNHALHEINKD